MQKYHNDHGTIAIPQEIAAIMPPAITECALFLQRAANEPCSDDATVTAIASEIGVSNNNSAKVIDLAKQKTGCQTEKCVIETLQINKGIITTNFKIGGPTDITLLNNYDIDTTMRQYCVAHPQFFAYNFNMVNYRQFSFRDGRTVAQPDSLETIQVAQLINKYRCCGCIINTDTYQGSGKHWMALFADWRDPNNCTVEFFNSSGNAPDPAWILWMERSRDALVANNYKMKTVNYSGFTSDLCRVTNRRHQQSKTECGVYSLFYIWARLCGIRPDFFNQNFVPDQWIFLFRQHLFDGKESQYFANECGGRFDWDKYNRMVKVKWERTP